MQRTLIAIVALLLIGGSIYYMTKPAGPAESQQAVTVAPSDAAAPGDAIVAQPEATTSTTATPASGISAAVVATHASEADCWTILSGKVYDITSLVGNHPGGNKPILSSCGKDGTQTFNKMRGPALSNATNAIQSLYKGDLAL